jgi:guanyl-specific ribonuclease Sa
MKRIAPLFLLVVVIVALIWSRQSTRNAPTTTLSSGSNVQATAASAPSCSASQTPLPDFLPPQACDTLGLIAHQGPFLHPQDGVVFGNYEKLLPAQPRGYYHEYTVVTPGAPNRGTRRIITGGTPPTEYFYTDDHYRSFRRFQVTP